MELLQAALSMDKLASLIKSEYRSDTEALEELQNKLEGQFRLSSCSSRTCPIFWDVSYLLGHVLSSGTCPIFWDMSYLLGRVLSSGTCPIFWDVF